MIPKIMHQAFLSGEPPAPLRANVEAHKVRNPGWKHMLWDEPKAKDFMAAQFGNVMLQDYLRIDSRYPAARVDLLCNLIIYHYGGVYFDIKSVFERPLDDILFPTDRYLLAQWRNGPGQERAGWGLHHDLAQVPGGEYMKYFIVAEPQHPYTKAIIDRILKNLADYRPWHAVGRTGVLRTTGPIAYTLAIESVKRPELHRMVTEEEIGAKVSIGGDYNHQQNLKKPHYSTLKVPVVQLSQVGRWISALLNTLRTIKSSWANPA